MRICETRRSVVGLGFPLLLLSACEQRERKERGGEEEGLWLRKFRSLSVGKEAWEWKRRKREPASLLAGREECIPDLLEAGEQVSSGGKEGEGEATFLAGGVGVTGEEGGVVWR